MMYVDKFVIYVRIISFFILLSNYKYPKVELHKTNFSNLADRYQEFKRQWTFTTQKPRLSKNWVTILPKLPSIGYRGHIVALPSLWMQKLQSYIPPSQAFGYRWYIVTLPGVWIQMVHSHHVRSLDTEGTQTLCQVFGYRGHIAILSGLWVQRAHSHPTRSLDTKGTQLHSLPGLWVQRAHSHPARFLNKECTWLWKNLVEFIGNNDSEYFRILQFQMKTSKSKLIVFGRNTDYLFLFFTCFL